MLIVTPVVLLVAGVVRGVDGLVSAAIGLVLVALNFLVSARLITYTARRSPGAVMGVVLGGYIVRLGLLFGIALALEHRVVDRHARCWCSPSPSSTSHCSRGRPAT